MKYAKIKNGKVVDVVTGLQPNGYVEVTVNWSMPTTYPSYFYYFKTSKPILSVVDGAVFEDLEIILKPLHLIKNKVYEQLKLEREKLEKIPINYLGIEIDISTDKKRSSILSLKAKAKKVKVKDGQWLDLTKSELEALQILIDDTAQAWYDTEYAKTVIVDSLITIDDVKNYVTT